MRKRKWGNKVTTLSMILVMLLTMIPSITFADSNDISEHWAGETIQEWLSKGLASGYPDNTFRPDDKISRAEFITLVNKAFYFTQETTINFNDVSSSEWYYSSVKKAIAAGYIEGYSDNTIAPEDPITRQEAAIIIAKVKKLDLYRHSLNEFSDSSFIDDWSREYVSAVVTAGFMKGYPDGTFRPSNNIDRAEAIVALNNALLASYTIYDTAGTYGPLTEMETIDHTVVVKADGVRLQNLNIQGDLIISEEVASGNVTLNNLKVDGETYIRGGGTNSIHINGGKYNKVTVQKTSSGNVRIVATNIDGLKVVLSENATGQRIVLEGAFENIQVNAADVAVFTQGETSIAKMNVSNSASNLTVHLGENTLVKTMKIDTKLNLTGKGTITLAEVSVDDVTFQTTPTETVINSTIPVTPDVSSSGSSNDRRDDNRSGSRSDSNGGTAIDQTVAVTGVTNSTTTMALTVGGSTGIITATVNPTNATNKSVTWTSSNPTVATVSNGVVTPLAAGTTNVIVTSVSNATMSATCEVTVTENIIDASTPSAITLAVGSINPVGGITNVAIPSAGGTDTTGAITEWTATTGDQIKFTVTDAGSATSSITFNGSAYTSGADYIITSTSALTVVVTTSETGKTTSVRTFTITVDPAVSLAATTPSAITLEVGNSNPVGSVTNVTIPSAGGTDTTGAVQDWSYMNADRIKFTVTDSGSATSSLTFNGSVYTSGADYIITSTSASTVVVTTTEIGKTTTTRTFTISVAENAVQAATPSAMFLSLGGTNPVGGLTNVAIPSPGGTDTTGALTGWVATSACAFKFTVVDSGSAVSLIQINGSNYTNGADYNILSSSTVEIVVVTIETGKATSKRTFLITVQP